MKCHKHPSLDAVGNCLDCGVGLCQECVHTFSIPVCSKCNLVRLVNEKSMINSTFIKNTLIGILVGFYLFGMGTKQYGTLGDNMAIIFGLIYLYFGFFMMYGWTFINSKKNPNSITLRVNEGIMTLIIRKAFKFGFSCLIGGFVGPYQAWKMKQRLKTINETTKFIQEKEVIDTEKIFTNKRQIQSTNNPFILYILIFIIISAISFGGYYFYKNYFNTEVLGSSSVKSENSQNLKIDSITKSLSSINNTSIKKESNYVINKLSDGKYEVLTYKLYDEVFTKRLATARDIPQEDISIKKISPQKTLELKAIQDSKNPQKLKELIDKLNENIIIKIFGEDLESIINYTVDSDDLIEYKDQIKELSQYKKFAMTVTTERKISIEDISIKNISSQETLELKAIQDSKNPQKLKSLIEKLNKNIIINGGDSDLKDIIIYTVGSDDLVAYKDQIKELSQYKMFAMTVN